MEKYKANHNSKNPEEIEEKSEKEQKEEATSKALDAGLTLGLDAYTGGQFSQIKDGLSKVPGIGKMVDKEWNKNINKVAKVAAKTPVGDIAKGMDDSGITDTVKAGYDMYKGVKNGNGTNSINKMDTSNLGKSKTGTSNSFLTDNIMSFGISKSLKIKIMIGLGISVFLLLMIVTIVSGKDFENLDLTNESTMIAKNSTPTSTTVENKIIYFGSSNVQNIELNNTNDNISYIKNSTGDYNWLVNEGSIELENMINNNPNGIVVISLGENDLENIDSYVTYYNELINKYPNTKFHFISVNPIDESSITEYTNQDVINFNNKLSSRFPEQYINTYDELLNNNLLDDGSNKSDIYDKIHSTVKSSLSGFYAGGDLLVKLEEVANWYIANVATYGQGKTFKNPFMSKAARADCTGFAVTYMSYVSGADLPISSSAEMVYHNGSWAKKISELGWKGYTTDEIEPQPGDVLVSNPVISYSKGNHAEIYVSETETFGWGSKKTKYPTSSSLQKSTKQGHVIYSDNVGSRHQHDYVTIYRFTG